MLTVSGSARIYLAAGATDMRKSFNGLYALSKGKLGADPLEGHLFLFCNRRRYRVKALFWDGTGLWAYRALSGPLVLRASSTPGRAR